MLDMKRWPVVVAVTMLLMTWGSIQLLSHGEPTLSKKPFAEFPLAIRSEVAGERAWDGTKRAGYLETERLHDACLRSFSRQSNANDAGLALRRVLSKPANRIDVPFSKELFAGFRLAIRRDRSCLRAGVRGSVHINKQSTHPKGSRQTNNPLLVPRPRTGDRE